MFLVSSCFDFEALTRSYAMLIADVRIKWLCIKGEMCNLSVQKTRANVVDLLPTTPVKSMPTEDDAIRRQRESKREKSRVERLGAG